MRYGWTLTAFLLASTAFGLENGRRTDAASDSTITSDEMEIRDNGEQTNFKGHVILRSGTSVLLADEMTRTRSTGVVKAMGHLEGTWISDNGERITAYGNEGEYTEHPQKTELWGNDAHIIRWAVKGDSEPVRIDADRFEADHQTSRYYAMGHVIIAQKPKILAKSDQAVYDEPKQRISLQGPSRISIHLADTRGRGDFTADRGDVTLNPRTAHLEGSVQGHVDPDRAL